MRKIRRWERRREGEAAETDDKEEVEVEVEAEDVEDVDDTLAHEVQVETGAEKGAETGAETVVENITVSQPVVAAINEEVEAEAEAETKDDHQDGMSVTEGEEAEVEVENDPIVANTTKHPSSHQQRLHKDSKERSGTPSGGGCRRWHHQCALQHHPLCFTHWFK
eukprot:m.63155 g.63155  ORF g.63155 m.63155 type:complete len:165 (-) comp11427_c1_seq2:1675-2169(-)